VQSQQKVPVKQQPGGRWVIFYILCLAVLALSFIAFDVFSPGDQETADVTVDPQAEGPAQTQDGVLENGSEVESSDVVEETEPTIEAADVPRVIAGRLPEGVVGRLGYGHFRDVVFAPDGTSVIVSAENGLLRFVPGAMSADWFIPLPEAAAAVAVSADSRTIASADQATITLWETATGSPTSSVIATPTQIRTMAFSNDSRLLAAGSDNGTVTIWRVADGEVVQRIDSEAVSNSPVYSVAFSDDGNFMAAGFEDGNIRVWNIESNLQPIFSQSAHSQPVTVVAFSSNNTIASGGGDGLIVLWDSIGTRTGVLPESSGPVTALQFNLTGDRLLSGYENGKAVYWNLETSGPADELPVPNILEAFGGSSGVIDQGVVAQWTTEGTLTIRKFQVVDTPQEPIFATPLTIERQGHTAPVTRVAYSEGGGLIASGARDGSIIVWDAASGQRLHLIDEHTTDITGLVFSGNMLFSSSLDGLIYAWDIDTGERLSGDLTFIDNGVPTAVTSLDMVESSLVASYSNRISVIWNIETSNDMLDGEFDRQFYSDDTPGRINSVSLSPEGDILAAGCQSGIVGLWSVTNGELLRTIDIGESGAITSLDIESGWISAGLSNGQIAVWELGTSFEQAVLIRPGDSAVTNVQFSRDGRYLSGAWADGTAAVWSVADIQGQPAMQMKLPDISSNAAAIAPDNSNLIVGTSNGTTLYLLEIP